MNILPNNNFNNNFNIKTTNYDCAINMIMIPITGIQSITERFTGVVWILLVNA